MIDGALHRCLIGLCVVWMTSLSAQVSFELDRYQTDGGEVFSGVATAVVDLNGDQLDDLVLFNRLNDVIVRYQLTKGVQPYSFINPDQALGHVWAVVAADVNGDDVKDLIIGDNAEIYIWTGEGQIPIFTSREQALNENMFNQAMNVVDMDGDGDLDLFICNDIGRNFIGLNNGQGVFTEAPSLMDFRAFGSAVPAAGNYGSVWCDYDRDGDQDLYIARCLGGTTSPDTILANQFFTNNGDGTFTRETNHPQLLSSYQSWAADFIDVENDGDWDLYIVHHDRPAQLFIQDDHGQFIDESELRGVDVTGASIQIVSADYDADGYIDLYVTGNGVSYMLMNDGTGHFTDQIGSLPTTDDVHTAVNGDFNHDGYVDLHVAYGLGYNQVGSQSNELWYNTARSNHYLVISLRDEGDNRDAIGATIEVHTDLGIQMREIRAGESYGISRSTTKHFGLGDEIGIDSVVVYWPDGTRQRFDGLEADRRYTLYRSGDVFDRTVRSEIQVQSNFLCDGDSVVLSIDGDLGAWSTGGFGREITVDTPGLYSVTELVDNQVIRSLYQIWPAEDARLDLEVPELLCKVSEVELTADDPYVRWSTGDTTQTVLAPTDDLISYHHRGGCGLESPEVYIEVQYPVVPTTMHDTVDQGLDAVLHSADPHTLWSTTPDDDSFITISDSLVIPEVLQDSTVYARTYDPLSVGSVGPLIDGHQTGYHFSGIAGEVYFLTRTDVLLRTVVTECRTAGDRRIMIIDTANQQVYFDRVIGFDVGVNEIAFNTFLPGDRTFVIRTDTSLNQDQLGIVSPDFVRVLDLPTPIVSPLLNILGSTLDPSHYYYYFDWRVEEASMDCLSDPVAVLAVVDSGSSTETVLTTGAVSLVALGQEGTVLLAAPSSDLPGRLSLYDLQGREIHSDRVRRGDSQLFHWRPAPGVYIARYISHTGAIATCKLLVEPR